MKKFIYMFLFFSLLFTGNYTHAFEFNFWEDVEIVEEVTWDLYLAGGRTEIIWDVDGDVIIAGGEIIIDGNVSQDALLAWGEIVLSGVVGDDVRVAGWAVEIQADIMGDLIVFGGEVRIDKDVTIHGDIVAFAGKIILNGNVEWDLRIKAWSLAINGIVKGDADLEIDEFKTSSWSGAIQGTLTYSQKEKNETLEQFAQWEIVFNIKTKDISKKWEKNILWVSLGYYVFKVLGVFIFASLLYFFFEKVFYKVGTNLKKYTGKSFLYGFLLIIGTPFLITLLCITVIGIPFALLTLCLYIFMFVFAKLLNVVVITSMLSERYTLDTIWKKLLVISGLTLLFCSVWIISMIVAIFVFGAIIIYKIELIQKLRK